MGRAAEGLRGVWRKLLTSCASCVPQVAIGSLHHLFVDAYEHASEFVVRVSAPLIKVFFEMLLRCRMQDPTFWITLTGLFTSWTHLLPVCVQWSAVYLAITRRAINILFGPSYGVPMLFEPTRSSARLLTLFHLNRHRSGSAQVGRWRANAVAVG
jgi:hypothetical protein